MDDARTAVATASEALRVALDHSFKASCAKVDAWFALQQHPASAARQAAHIAARHHFRECEQTRYQATMKHNHAVSDLYSWIDQSMSKVGSSDPRRELDLQLCDRAGNGDLKGCQRLLELGASIDAQDNFERSALARAVTSGQLDLCLLLLSKNANLCAPNRQGRAPLHDAARCGHAEICRALVRHAAVVDQLDIHGATALHIATEYRRREVCIALIESGANVNAPSKLNERPLDIALKQGNIDLCRALLKYGANVNPTHDWDQSILKVAAKKRRVDICLMLVAYGAIPLGINGSNQALRRVLGMSQLRAAVNLGDAILVLNTIECDPEPTTLTVRVQREISLSKAKNPELASVMRSWVAQRAANDVVTSLVKELGTDVASVT